MSITFNTLPDIIIDEILSKLDLSDQVELRFCNRRISSLLKYIVFEVVPVPKFHNDIKYMAPQIGKYVKWLRGSIYKEFFEVKDNFSKLEHINVDKYIHLGTFDLLHSLDIKLKSMYLELYDPLPTQPQLNFNQLIENLVKLDITIRNKKSKSLDAFKMFQIPNLKTLLLTINRFPEDTLVTINRNFPDLRTLSLRNRGHQLKVTFTATTFLKLKKLSLFLSLVQNYDKFPFQSFPQLKDLEFGDTVYERKQAIKVIKENLFSQLLNLSIEMTEFSKDDYFNLQNLKYAHLELREGFDIKCMQRLLSLPKLSQLNLTRNVSDNIFQNVVCKSPLLGLTIFGRPVLSQHFLKFLQFNAPSLTRLKIFPFYDHCAFEANTFSGSDSPNNLNLLHLHVHKEEEKFVNWVKAQSPNVYVAYFDW